MTYKNYTIYLKLELDCPDKSTKQVVDKARAKALEEAKLQFPKDIEYLIKSKDIELKRDQTDPNGVMIGINEDKLEETIKSLVALDIVSIIDAEYSLEPTKEKKTTKTTKKQ